MVVADARVRHKQMHSITLLNPSRRSTHSGDSGHALLDVVSAVCRSWLRVERGGMVVGSTGIRAQGWMLEYRNALREALGRLDPATGPVLLAGLASGDGRRCDIENLVLYNVGLSAFTHLRCREVVLARSFAPSVAPPECGDRTLIHHHRYQLAAEAPPGPAAQVIARFSAIALRRPVTVEKVWYDLRASGELAAEGPSPGRPLGST